LDEEVEDGTVLVDGAPERVYLAAARNDDLVQVPVLSVYSIR